ncbi:MAG: hypothetical protein K6U88_12380, partial [Dehalococcoidia bacterium]|nr:hypothetical protein [Dehalococcoidia bacterium]
MSAAIVATGRAASQARRRALSQGKAALPPPSERVRTGFREAALPAPNGATPASAASVAAPAPASSTVPKAAAPAIGAVCRQASMLRRQLLARGKAAFSCGTGAPAGSAGPEAASTGSTAPSPVLEPG